MLYHGVHSVIYMLEIGNISSGYDVGSDLLLLSSFSLVSLKNSHSFLNLALEGILILQHVNKLSVINLEQHAGDLACQIGEHPLDEREETLTQHLLLFLWRSRSEHGSSEGLLSLHEHSLLGRGLAPTSHHAGAWQHGSWRVAGSGRVLEALLGRAHLLGLSHGYWWHALGPCKHGHGGLSWLHAWSRSSHPWSSWKPWCPPWTPNSNLARNAWPWYCLLLWPPGLSSYLSRSEESLWLGHSRHEIATHAHLLHATHLLHTHTCHALNILRSEVSLPVLLPLGESHIEGLGNDDTTVHFSDSFGGFLGRGETDESKALAATLLTHHLGGGDSTVGGELLAKTLVVDGVIQVLHIQVNTLVPIEPLQLELFELFLEFLLPLGFLLSPTHVKGLSKHLYTIKFLHCLLSRFSVLEGYESKTLVLTRIISNAFCFLWHRWGIFILLNHFVRSYLSKLREEFFQFVVAKLVAEVLDVYVGELLGFLSELLLPLLARDEAADKDLLLVEQHTIDLLDSVEGSFLSFKMHKSITLAASISILGDLAGQDVPEGGESVIHSFVVDRLVEVFDEHISNARPPERRIPLAPHDPDGAALQHVKVHRVQGSLGISRLLEVDVGISEGPPGNHVPAHTDGEDRARGGELLEEHRLGYLGGQIAHIERGHGIVWAWGPPWASGSWGRACCCLHSHTSTLLFQQKLEVIQVS